jgi:hypothetical protein
MKKIASRLLKTIILAIFVFPSIHPGRMGIGNYFMNTNVDLFHDSTKNSSEILTSESNETGSLKIIMPDKLNQLTARSSYICHIDDFVKGNKDYYGFDIQSDSEMEYDYELIINKIKHINNNTGKHEYISIFNNFPVLGFMLCQIANLNDLRILGGYRYSIRLKNISERDIVIDYINSIFITYDNICIYKVDNIDVRRDIPREFIDDLNALYKTIIDNIFGYRFSIRVVTGYDNCIVDNIEVFVPVKSNMDISNSVSNMFRKFLNAKRIDFFNLISVFEYFNDINNLSIGHLITKIYKDFIYLYDMSFDILDNKIVYTYLGSGNIDGYIKIGKTNNIDKRENTIRTGNIDFKIIAFVGRDIENELHSKFEIKRMEREWFHLSDNDIDNIINEYGFIRVRNSVKDKKI